jgi:uncharacterized protein (TIGR03032 family)
MKSSSRALRDSFDFANWMIDQDLSVGFTTGGPNDLVLLGRHDDGSLSVFSRQIDRCKKLWSDGKSLWISTRNHLWRFDNCLDQSQNGPGFDRMYIPRHGIATGELDVQDVAVEAHGRVVFVSSVNCCLATYGDSHRVVPFWKSSAIRRFTDHDRCQLSGLALENGYSKYVTAFDRTTFTNRLSYSHSNLGCVVDIESDEIVATGLSMPQSPRMHDGRLWLLNSGTGHLGFIDFATGNFYDVLRFPGVLAGLAFHGDYAIIGLTSSPRHAMMDSHPFDHKGMDSGEGGRCEIQVIDMTRGVLAHRFAVSQDVSRVDDVVLLKGVTLPGFVRPQAVGFDLDHPEDEFQNASKDRLKQFAST